MFDVQGRRHAVVASTDTIGYLASGAASWSTLSYVAGTSASNETAQADLENAWDGASIYDLLRDETLCVLTNNRQLPKFLEIRDSTTTFSDFTWIISQFSRARAVCEFDASLVWFNVSSSATSFPTRVAWTPRGSPTDYAVANGYGFEDLMDMRGNGLRVIADDDSIVLFTEEQIWRGLNVRGSAYRFSFSCINRKMGCPYPRTITQTPRGIVFLGRDREMYLLSGNETIPLGPTYTKPAEVGDHSRVQLHLQSKMMNGDLAHGMYNSEANRAELYYTSNETNTNFFPQNRLDYNFDNSSFFVSKFSHQISCAFEMQDVDESLTWDSIPYEWNQYNVPWDTAGLGVVQRRSVVFSSAGTPYRFRSDQTTDDGTAIDARWRSHGLGQDDQFRYDELWELGVEYKSDATSSISVYVSEDLGATFYTDALSKTLSATSGSLALCPVLVTAPSPIFELRTNDGSVPKISRMQARLRDAGLYGGAL